MMTCISHMIFEPFDGDIALIRIYDSGLSPEEVKMLANMRSYGFRRIRV